MNLVWATIIIVGAIGLVVTNAANKIIANAKIGRRANFLGDFAEYG